jgi:DNA-binding transcriptional LysR family regulator
MDLRQFEAFQAVIEHKSMSRAAEALGISQPAVSALIARLEKQLNFPLFTRAKQRLDPTLEANFLYLEVVPALSGMAKLSSFAEEIRLGRLGTLTVAAHPTVSISWLPSLVAQFQRSHPGVTVRIVTRSSRLLRESIPANSFDVGIAESPMEQKAVSAHTYRFRCVVALPTNHRLVEQKSINLRMLSDEPLIALTKWQSMSFDVGRAFDQARSRANIVTECEFFHTALSLVKYGVGVTICEPISARAEQEAGNIVVRPLDQEILYSIALFYSSERPLSRIANDFADRFRRHIAAFLR